MGAKITAREAAYLSLVRMETKDRFSNLELDSAIKKYGLEDKEKALYTKLLYGVLERKLTLDAVIAEKANRKACDIDCGALCLLRIGAYQLFFLERIPVSAACNEGVKLAGKYCPKAKGFVNAVMRSLAALSPDGLFDLIKNGAKSDTEYLSLRYSISESISKLLCEQYGYSGAEKMLSSLYPESQITSIRVNTLKSTANELLKAFEGADAMLSEITDKCINIRGNFVPEAYEEFEKGCFFIQSEPSCICASALGARKGDRVIDACACPGGKTFSIAIDMENEGEIKAFDLHKNKLSLIEKGVERLGITTVSTAELDGRLYVPEFEKAFDRVLCDVPCSGLGSISKKPEIRYKDTVDFEPLPAIQLDILKNNARYLKKGGVLVYSTCTVNKKENGEVVKAFLDICGEEFETVKPDIPTSTEIYYDGLGVTFLPCKKCGDGFYVAKLIRK